MGAEAAAAAGSLRSGVMQRLVRRGVGPRFSERLCHVRRIIHELAFHGSIFKDRFVTAVIYGTVARTPVQSSARS